MSKNKQRRSASEVSDDTSRSTRVLNHQLGNAKDSIRRLETENEALRGELRRAPDELLVEVASALRIAQEAVDARKGHSFDDSGVPQHGEHQIPGQGTANARWFVRRLRKDIRKAVGDFTSAALRNWPKPPLMTRCRNRECRLLDRWVPAWDRHGANEFCQKCGNRLASTFVTADFA